MDPTGAERSRRYRAHRRGDHSRCLPGCTTPQPAAATTAAPDPSGLPSPVAPGGLGARGRRLWADLATPDRTPGELVLAEEAARLADRLDRLDRVLSGDAETWMRLAPAHLDEPEMVIEIDNALSQARMNASALRGIVTELRQSAAQRATGASARPAAGVSGPAGAPAGQASAGGSLLDDLAARRARRIADATGL